MTRGLRSLFKNDSLESEFLPPALEIIEQPPSPVGRLLIWLILIITLSAFIWSYLGSVDQVAVARGKVIPDGKIKVIQPMETGAIRAIHVKEGQQVKEGEVLIELDPTIKQADVESTTKALSIHMSNKERLVAELAGIDMVDSKEDGIFEFQRRLKEARESEYKSKEDALRFVIAQRKDAVHSAEAILVKLEKTCAILKEQEKAFRDLYEKGYMSKMDLLDKQRDLYSVEQEMEAQRRAVKQTKDSLEESRKNRDVLKQEREKVILSDLVEMEKNISALSGEAIKAQKRYDLEILRSPVTGTVHGLASYTVGGVVTPAQPIVTIVPNGTPLIVEATVLNKDIGFLRTGQEAEVKFDTFPFQKYGTIKGKVASISPDAFEDEKLGPVYKIKTEMERLSLTVDGKDVPLSPGMAVSVEVKTGKRRIIEFFLSPIIKYANEGLTLR